MAKKRYKLTFAIPSAYGLSNNSWAFVKKVKGGFQALHGFQTCKDYMHEVIANAVYDENRRTSVICKNRKDVQLDKLQIALAFSNFKGISKKNLYSVKRYINTIEKACGITQTTIVEIDSERNNSRVFILTGDKVYIESPALLHGLVAMMRTMYHAKKIVSVANVSDVMDGLIYKDSRIIKFMVKHDIFKLIMGNHKCICSDIPLEDMYVVTSNYHSGFGMAAVCEHDMANKKYSANINKVLKEATVPRMV